MLQKITVLPSARAIRHEQQKIDSSTLFLPNYITINEFINKMCIVKEFKLLDEDSRVLLLLEASNFKGFDSLKIERNFFTFTKNSSYIFKFFEELSAEKYDISDLDSSDIYAEYEEHIEILQELYKRYESLCLERQLLDRIFLPKLYTFNKHYIESYSEVELKIDGHLTNFEFELINLCAKNTKVTIVFSTSSYNTKMQSKFLELGIELEVNYNYVISLNPNIVLSKSELIANSNVSCEGFSESILQIAYIKNKVYEFIQKGYSSEKIAVILPDEKMANRLKSFDNKSNFNFAMGESFIYSSMYKKLDATVMALSQHSKENHYRLSRFNADIYVKLLHIYYKKLDEVDFIEFLNEYKQEFSNKQEIKIFEEEIYSFSSVLTYMKDMSIKSLLSLFLQRLSKRSLDDVRGGKITVMGVLETRSVAFDAVVIVDFDDSNVPKKSNKDMFLNTQIRVNANLPTMGDRENLQKHYYYSLINSSKEVCISYTKSAQSSVSRFLKQLTVNEVSSFSELEYSKILFTQANKIIEQEEEIVLDYSFKNVKLSATKLKTFLSCKRKYYFKYIQYIKGHEIPKDMPKEHEIGTAVHEALKELYAKKDSYLSLQEIKRDLYKELDGVCGESELEKYLIDIQKRLLENFCRNEVETFKEKWRVAHCEKSLSIEYFGMTLVGQIDRIDKRNNEIRVLDYKTGSYPLYNKNNFTEATDFQLEFYYLLASGFGNVVECAYYDLKESKVVLEPFLEEKLEILKSHISDLLNIEEVNFEKCEDIKNCQYCEYKIMCGRE